jgi:hypothetical protein
MRTNHRFTKLILLAKCKKKSIGLALKEFILQTYAEISIRKLPTTPRKLPEISETSTNAAFE